MAITFVTGLTVTALLLYAGKGYWGWITGLVTVVIVAWLQAPVLAVLIALPGVILTIVFGLPRLRQRLVSSRLISLLSDSVPHIGDTERIALEAGTVWWDGELFSGKPNWRRLLDFPVQTLSEEERAFLDGPVETLCQMLNDWDIAQHRDLSPETWHFLKEQGFFGMIIPKRFGGKEFSAIGHSAVVTKIASRSTVAAVTVMVPNSLGPAELLLHYGTEEQQHRYLPRLAHGQDLPCFALTGPEAGSDAAATQSTGHVMMGNYQGEEVLGIRLNWRKRYITLAPVANLIGLAFRLYDPDQLLGGPEDLGITCALVPRDLDGIEIGQRHDPMGIAFMNGPTIGLDVFVPLDFVIGAREGIGEGWRMLMESLAAGRCISLPAMSVAAAQLSTRVVGAYSTIREQFDTPIGRFEGVEEPLARIAGHTYWMSAARRLSCGALDAGEKPSVISAIIKAYLTEGMRSVLNDAMDIRAGSAIMRGPRNVLSRNYTAVPIAITVEGSNILTRSMIIYGQGAIRSHPFVHAEMTSMIKGNIAEFDFAFFGHVNFFCSNLIRTLLLGLTGSRFVANPGDATTGRYYQQLTRMSSAFALTSDVCMLLLGGKLKRKEKLSGRLGDVLAWMYLASSALKQYEDDARQETDRPLVAWACEHALSEIQTALLGLFHNLPVGWIGHLLCRITFPLGRHFLPPNDQLGSTIARSILEDRAARRTLTRDIHVPGKDEAGLGRLEAALENSISALQVESKLRDALRAGDLDHAPGLQLANNALKAGLIDHTELRALKEADEIRDEVIQVDAFDPQIYAQLR